MGGMATRPVLPGRVAFKDGACEFPEPLDATAHRRDRTRNEALHDVLQEVEGVMREHVCDIATTRGLLPRKVMFESRAQVLEERALHIGRHREMG
jgi:hypothetical protein